MLTRPTAGCWYEGSDLRALAKAAGIVEACFYEPSAARVRVMAWQWTAAKRNPRVYADKIDATVTINVGLAERLSAAIGRASRVIDVDAEPSGDVGEIG